ncbi:hypothetical protein [Nitrincola sp. MINF-07-Sa-05]|uniref:hypothetical protein n=1 Tax=Nitrincola salilacus TaxID=3400273 RepID=UPI0039185397
MKSSVNHGKVIVAFFAATLASVLALPVFECAVGLIPGSGYHCGESFIAVLLIGPFIAIPAILFVALPLFLAMQKCRWTAWWQIVPAASVASIVGFLLLSPVLLFGSFSAIYASAFVVLPVLLVIGRSRSVNWWRITLGGCIASAVIILAVVIAPLNRLDTGLIGLFGYVGACAGIVFWLVGVRGNFNTQQPDDQP